MSAAFSPDGTRVVTASDDQTARVWDVVTGKPLTRPLEHQDRVGSAAFSPDGTRVVNVLGCHFNELTFELLDSDGMLSGNSVVTLVDALVDKDVGWPRSDKSGSYWATAGDTRRLHPLRQPR